MIKIYFGKVLLWGGVSMICSMIVGNVLYMNPLVRRIFKKHQGHPSQKSMDFIGGQARWILVTMIFGICLGILFIALYLLLYQSLPGTPIFKGLFFGTMIFLIKAVPEAFNQWMIFNYPNILILVQLINSFIGLILSYGIIMPFLFSRFRVLEIIN